MVALRTHVEFILQASATQRIKNVSSVIDISRANLLCAFALVLNSVYELFLQVSHTVKTRVHSFDCRHINWLYVYQAFSGIFPKKHQCEAACTYTLSCMYIRGPHIPNEWYILVTPNMEEGEAVAALLNMHAVFVEEWHS